MTLNQTEELLKSAAAEAAGEELTVFSGCMPLGARRAALVTIKSANCGNDDSDEFIFTITLRSPDRKTLLRDAENVRRSLAEIIHGNLILELLPQDLITEGVKGEFLWTWQTSFDIRIFENI